MISWMVAKSGDQKQAHPEPRCCYVTSSHNDSHENTSQVDDQVFKWMWVQSDDCDACRPLVVDFMNAFVKQMMMK